MALFTRQLNIPTFSNYKKYKSYLREDFRRLCAYCERPEKAIGGVGHCEIDHFKPREIAPELLAVYENLYYCCRECNNRKSKKWPSKDYLKRGRRFSDPCKEDLYQDHCTEQWDGRLIYTTECGRFTIDAIFLYCEELVEWREERRKARRDLTIWLRFRTELLEQQEAAKDTETGRRVDNTIAALDRFVARSRMMYGL